VALRPYLRIARPDHWFKNLLALPGTALAAYATSTPPSEFAAKLLVGLLAMSLVASANYVINEWLDLEFDRFHPLKKDRPSVAGQVSAAGVGTEYVVLVGVSLLLARWVGLPFLGVSVLFLVMGACYNIPPIRTKDLPYLDVLSESFNNPIRLILGWFVVTAWPLPPGSIVLGYWMAGAFVMAVKRYAELRFLGSKEVAGRYRRSFHFYSEEGLLISAMFYACCASFFVGVFLVKYRVELLISLPFLALVFAWYLRLGMKADSPAQRPERLYRETGFVAYLVLVVAVLVLSFVVEIPELHWFLQRVISLPE